MKGSVQFLFMLAVLLASMVRCHTATHEIPTLKTDSIAFIDAHWQIDTLDGFYLKRHHFKHKQIFNSNQYFSIIEIPAHSRNRLAFACCDSVLTTTSELAQQYNALAAINGSFFDMNLGNPICFLRIDSIQKGINEPAKTDTINRKYYQYGTLTLYNGRPRIFHTDSSRFWENRLSYKNIMTAGPLLIHNRKPQPMRDDRSFVTARHNRTAIGIKPDGTIVLLIVDGRFKRESEGLSLVELIQTMRWLGCSEALNLDGGGSTTMYVKGIGDNGVVNHPSDNHHYDHKGERPVSNILMVLRSSSEL